MLNHRGHARLNIAAGAGGGKRRQVLLPIPWECDQVDQIRDAVVQVYDEFQQGIEPDTRWRYAFQLMAAYGLRPEELQHLQIRQGRLWCMDEKVASRGKTRPRVLRTLPCDDWVDGWRLEERFPAQELPPMQTGLGGGYVGHYLMNRPLWKELRREYEAKGEKLVPYSCRHGYAHRAHVICDLPPKVVAAAMGHSVQTHLSAYSRWCGDEVVDDAFAKAEQRLAQG